MYRLEYDFEYHISSETRTLHRSTKFTNRLDILNIIHDPIGFPANILNYDKGFIETHKLVFHWKEPITITNIKIVEPEVINIESKVIPGKIHKKKIGTKSFTPEQYMITYCRLVGDYSLILNPLNVK